MINLISYFLAFFYFIALVSVLVMVIHYLIIGLGWLVECIFDPYLFK